MQGDSVVVTCSLPARCQATAGQMGRHRYVQFHSQSAVGRECKCGASDGRRVQTAVASRDYLVAQRTQAKCLVASQSHAALTTQESRSQALRARHGDCDLGLRPTPGRRVVMMMSTATRCTPNR